MTNKEKTKLLKQLKDNLAIAINDCDLPAAWKIHEAINRLEKLATADE